MSNYLVCTCGDSLGSEDPYCPAHGTPLREAVPRFTPEEIETLRMIAEMGYHATHRHVLERIAAKMESG